MRGAGEISQEPAFTRICESRSLLVPSVAQAADLVLDDIGNHQERDHPCAIRPRCDPSAMDACPRNHGEAGVAVDTNRRMI